MPRVVLAVGRAHEGRRFSGHTACSLLPVKMGLTFEGFVQFVNAVKEDGRKEGRHDVRRVLREALGR